MLVEKKLSSNGILRISLNRPEKLNALSRAIIDELTAEFRELAKVSPTQNPRVVILNSTNPKAFCVGADLSERMTMTEEEVLEALDALKALTLSLEAIPMPTICVIEGAAFGGGLELALCCDLRIAHPKAAVGLTETSLGIIPGAGGTQRLTRLIGQAAAKEIIFLARRLPAPEARDLGLLNLVADNPLETAESWAHELCSRGPLALRAAKRAIRGALDVSSLSEGLALEREAYLETLYSKDRKEGLTAFKEKRSPSYCGE